MEKELLQKYIEGNISPEETEEVVKWLDADAKHVDEYMSLHKVYNISIMNQDYLIENNKHKNYLLRFYSIITKMGEIAAVLLVFLCIQYFTNDFDNQEYLSYTQTIYSPAGQRTEILLPDSTKVWLNANSKLVYPAIFKKGIRTVKLAGEAYFDVKHDRKSPFIVETNLIKVKVLGTEFNISSYEESPTTQVSLLKGSIELSSINSDVRYRVEPGQQVTLKNDSYVFGTIKELDQFKWKDGLLCFYDLTIKEILKKLELYYDVTIKIGNQHFLQERYTGKFRTKDGIEQVLKILQIEHPFKYKRDNESNIITIN